MFPLHPFYCLEDLPDLIRFGLSLIILNIYAGITRPRRFIDPMASTCLSGTSKVMVADTAEIGKANPAGVFPHLHYKPDHGVHIKYSIIIDITRQ